MPKIVNGVIVPDKKKGYNQLDGNNNASGSVFGKCSTKCNACLKSLRCINNQNRCKCCPGFEYQMLYCKEALIGYGITGVCGGIAIVNWKIGFILWIVLMIFYALWVQSRCCPNGTTTNSSNGTNSNNNRLSLRIDRNNNNNNNNKNKNKNKNSGRVGGVRGMKTVADLPKPQRGG